MAFRQVMKKSIWITPDFQLIGNPGYNGDRGPVAIGSCSRACRVLKKLGVGLPCLATTSSVRGVGADSFFPRRK